MTAKPDAARIYVRKILQPYIDNALKKETYRSVPKPAVGTVFEAKEAKASVIYTHIGYLELNNPTGKKVYHHTLQDWCKSICVEEDAISVGI